MSSVNAGTDGVAVDLVTAPGRARRVSSACIAGSRSFSCTSSGVAMKIEE